MVKLCKNYDLPKQPATDARFARRTPSQMRFENQKPALRYKRARFYSAQLGRFISRDPIGFADGYNLYRAYFVPLGVDPSGLQQLPGTSPTPVWEVPTRFPVEYPRGRPFPPSSPPTRPVVCPRTRPTSRPIPSGPWVFISIILTTTTMGDSEYRPDRCPDPRPDPKPPYGPPCPNDCQKKWGYEKCPGPPTQSPKEVSEDFLDAQGVNNDPYRSFGISTCNKVQKIDKGPICPSGGDTYHCRVWVAEPLGVRETRKEVSVFTCNCCWEKYPGAYTKPVGTPPGSGAPHWQSETRGGGLGANGNPISW